MLFDDDSAYNDDVGELVSNLLQSMRRFNDCLRELQKFMAVDGFFDGDTLRVSMTSADEDE